MSISPWSDSHHNNDSNDDEDDDQPTAHPLARVLLVLLGLHKLIDTRLDMVSGLPHLSTVIKECCMPFECDGDRAEQRQDKHSFHSIVTRFECESMSNDWGQVRVSIWSKLSSCDTNNNLACKPDRLCPCFSVAMM